MDLRGGATVGNVPFSVKRFAQSYLQSHIKQVATKAHEFSGGCKVKCFLSRLGLWLRMDVSYTYPLRYQEKDLQPNKDQREKIDHSASCVWYNFYFSYSGIWSYFSRAPAPLSFKACICVLVKLEATENCVSRQPGKLSIRTLVARLFNDTSWNDIFNCVKYLSTL
jgi:hypothetical protein